MIQIIVGNYPTAMAEVMGSTEDQEDSTWYEYGKSQGCDRSVRSIDAFPCEIRDALSKYIDTRIRPWRENLWNIQDFSKFQITHWSVINAIDVWFLTIRFTK